MSKSGRVAALSGLVLAVWFTIIVVDHGWNPSTLLAAGGEDVRVTSYLAAQLGPNFEPQAGWGHDGKFVFVQAHDPLLLAPGAHAAVLDAPAYRSQRVLVPALVGVGGVFGEWGLVWAFPVLMVLAVIVGTWAIAALVERGGGSPWWGATFLFNPGLFYSYRRGTVDVVAVALLVLGVYLASAGRYRRAGAVLAAAVLAKEVMLLGAIGLAVHLVRHGRSTAVLVPPALTAIAWAGYVQLRLGEAGWANGVDFLTLPFRGVVPVILRYPDPSSIAAITVLVVAGAAVVRAVGRQSPASSAAVGFALLLPLLPEAVWGGYVDTWRVAAPILALHAAAVVPRVSMARLRRHAARETEPVAA